MHTVTSLVTVQEGPSWSRAQISQPAEAWFDNASRKLCQASWQHEFWPAMDAVINNKSCQERLYEEIFLYKHYNLHRDDRREMFQSAIATNTDHLYCKKEDFMRVVDCTENKTLAEVLRHVMEEKWTLWYNGGHNDGQPTAMVRAPNGAEKYLLPGSEVQVIGWAAVRLEPL
jgi:hypothetical protein